MVMLLLLYFLMIFMADWLYIRVGKLGSFRNIWLIRTLQVLTRLLRKYEHLSLLILTHLYSSFPLFFQSSGDWELDKFFFVLVIVKRLNNGGFNAWENLIIIEACLTLGSRGANRGRDVLREGVNYLSTWWIIVLNHLRIGSGSPTTKTVELVFKRVGRLLSHLSILCGLG